MQELKVTANEAGQRLDKLLTKYLNQAGKGFLYKMMRKKNITLNGKKCEGAERLEEGDVIRLFLADETIAKFSQITADLSFAPSASKVPADVERSAGIRKQHGLLQKDGKGKQRPGSKAGYHL